MSTYTYRMQERGDNEELCRLHGEYLGVERDDAFLNWKYWDNPVGPNRSVVGVENETGGIVAHIGSVAILYQYFGTPLRCMFECDIVVAERPDRGRIFFRMYRRRLEAIAEETGILPLSIAITIPKTAKIMGKLWKIRPIADAPKTVRILKHDRLLRARFGSPLLASAGGFVLDMWNWIRRPMVAPKGLDIVEIEAFDESADRFWERIKNYARIWNVRSSAYLNWRYIEIPNIDNKVFVAREGKEIVGYIVVYIWDGDIRRGVIQDFQFLKDRKDVGRALLRRGIDFMIGEKSDVAVSWTFSHSYTFPVLEEFGFRKREITGRTLSLRPAGEVVDPWNAVSWKEALNVENWHFCKGDTDDE
jgi:hypothetical protein